MNFFKSVFSDDPYPPRSQTESESLNNAPQSKVQEHPDRGSSSMSDSRSDVNPTSDDASGGGWNFGGLIKTLTCKSETIIETYRRDLKEFGSGLRKEIEVAQGSLGTVGHAIDEFGNTVVKGTVQIISQGKDAILPVDLEPDLDNNIDNYQKLDSGKSLNSKPYARFDAQVSAIQSDASTYCEEPEDLNDYKKWKSEFSLGGKSEEIESFLRANDAMESIYKRVVLNSTDHETFWCRYYYKVHKLKKAEDVRAKLVRGMSKEEEEDLSWDFEDNDEKDHGGKVKPNLVTNKEIGGEDLGKRADADVQTGSSAISNEAEIRRPNVEEKQSFSVEMRDNVIQGKEQGNKTDNSFEELKVESSVVNETGERSCNVDNRGKDSVKEADIDKASKIDGDTIVKKNDPAGKSKEKVIVEGKADDGKSSNEDEENEDLGWDEIEDLSSIDEKKATHSGSMDKVDLRKRLSAAEEEEDLSWDIEDDDDEPAKA